MRLLFFLSVILGFFTCSGQKFKSTQSVVSFFSEASVEDIAAVNEMSSSIFNIETGEVAFVIPIDKFQFEKSLMQEHFNEKYLESDKYPNASFSGKISGYSLTVKSAQSVNAKGKLTIHGVTREVSVAGTITLTGQSLELNAKFDVRLEDYKVKIPKLLWSNIAEQVEVTLDFGYSKM